MADSSYFRGTNRQEPDLDPMLLVGLTGNIAAGKSTVAQLLSERGATIIDADILARRAVERGTAAYDKIVQQWGPTVLGPDQQIDRPALRRIVFDDHDQLERLNSFVHPEVERQRGVLVEEARERGDRIVICDIPLLFEARLVDRFDKVILVDATRPRRLERLVNERQLPEAEAMKMIAAQMPAELKRARADHVIDNDGTIADLEKRVRAVWSELSADDRARNPAGVA
jgi:dephospho-CoA kinase